MRDGMNGTATFAVQGSAPAVAPLDHFEDGGGLVLESAWSHYQPHYPTASVKQEPVDHDVNNDSGISPGRCTGSSSGSDGPSPDRDNPRPNSNPLPNYPPTSQYHTPGRPDSSPAAGYHPHPSLRVSLSVTPNTPSSPSKFLSQMSQDGATAHNTPPPQPAANTQSPLSSGSVVSDHEQFERKNDDMLSQEAEDPLRRLQMALERSDMMGAVKSDREGSQDGNGSLMLQCVVCEFSTTSRSVFHSHVSSHYEPKGEGLSPDEDTDSEEAGLRTPRVNSQGKVKTFRCKQCDFVALTKLEFWEHSRGHIKADKLLTCPKCPFVTEYKHHLEYHLRNHFGSKPFKCDKCSYSCVNKSMLNSHLKSHSNVYQYRCNDCNYATKYCHSLKLHLRKYTHKPAMVLNPDGSPNPLPIIDVYGTRRGPKLRPKSDDSDSQKMSLQHNQQQQPLQQAPILPTQQQQIPPSQMAQFPMFQAFGMLAKPGTNGLPLPFPYGPLMNGAFPPTHSPVPPFPYSNNMRQEDSQKDSSDSSTEHSLLAQQLVNVNNNHPEQEGMKDYLARVITSRQLQIPRFPDFNSQYYQEEVKTPSNPLDLSKPIAFDMPPVFPNIINNNNNNNSNTNNNNTANSGTKNRRKGKAYKLERISISVPQESEDEDEELSPAKIQKLDEEQETETKDNPLPVTETVGKEMDDGKEITTSEVTSEESIQHSKEDSRDGAGDKVECHNCTYCDITFKDLVMYTMHMGYHGYQDPFKCNMCGQQTTDRVNFFLHIARSSHY
ncbi:protein hunchback [Anabrus simplex]|uniref:protein hunchback n=1 Tax=Anabrus simplex TaxID=316456 RepID=UPI0035A358B3